MSPPPPHSTELNGQRHFALLCMHIIVIAQYLPARVEHEKLLKSDLRPTVVAIYLYTAVYMA